MSLRHPPHLSALGGFKFPRAEGTWKLSKMDYEAKDITKRAWRVYMVFVLVRVSIAVKKRHEHSNACRGKHLIVGFTCSSEV